MKRMVIGLGLALAASPVVGATVTQDISIGVGSNTYGFTEFAPFDVGLGQLTQESIILSGVGTLSGTFPPRGPPGFSILLFDPESPGEEFSSGFSGDPAGIPISIDWTFAASNSSPSIDILEAQGFVSDFNYIMNIADLSGVAVYTYTPNATMAVPEPSSWAMMLLGFACLGYAGYRRAREPRAAQFLFHAGALPIFVRRSQGKDASQFVFEELITPPDGTAMERTQAITKAFGRLRNPAGHRGACGRATNCPMKLDPVISLAVGIGIILGLLVGGWNGPPFGKDGAVEQAHEHG